MKPRNDERRDDTKRVRMLTTYTTDARTSYSTRKECKERGEPGLTKENTWNRCHVLQKGLPEQSNTVWSWCFHTYSLLPRVVFNTFCISTSRRGCSFVFRSNPPPLTPCPVWITVFFFPFAVSHYYLGIRESNIPSETIKVSSLSAQ